MKTRNKRRLLLVVSLLLLMVWLGLVIKVNVEKPPIPLETYYRGDTFTYAGREITVEDFTILDGEATKKLLAQTDENWYREIIESYDSERIRMGLLYLNIQNISDKPMNHGIGAVGYSVMITPVDSLSSYYDDVSALLNQQTYGDDWAKLDVNEEKEYVIAYFLDSSWMLPKWWEKVETMPYEFIVDDYPVEIRISTAEKKES